MSNKSKIYQTISKHSIEKIVKDSFDLDTIVISFRELKGGLFNTTYLVNIGKPLKKLVLRIAPINQELLIDFEKTMMSREENIYKLLQDKGVPTPRVIKYDNTCEVIPREYILLEYVEGIPLSSPLFPEEYREKIQYDLGAYTAKIHGIKASNFGWASEKFLENGFKSWGEFIKVFTDEISEKAYNNNVFEESYIKEFNDFFHNNINLFDIKEEPSLIHNDLWEPNIIVKPVGNSWDIAAIIDADRALYGHREYEFVLWSNNPSFMRGYNSELDMSPEGRLRRKAYALILSFFNSYANKVQYDNEVEYMNCKSWALNELKDIKAFK